MAKQVLIENPVIVSPFEGPTRHFRLGMEGVTDAVVDRRQPRCHSVPVAQSHGEVARKSADTGNRKEAPSKGVANSLLW